MIERRQFLRLAIRKSAKVLFNENKFPLDCIVFDLSNHGAGIQIALNLYAPKWFE